MLAEAQEERNYLVSYYPSPAACYNHPDRLGEMKITC
jgi:hypothetical protein